VAGKTVIPVHTQAISERLKIESLHNTYKALYKFICLLTYFINLIRFAPKAEVLTSIASSQKLTYSECSGSTMTIRNTTYYLTHVKIFINSFHFENISAKPKTTPTKTAI